MTQHLNNLKSNSSENIMVINVGLYKMLFSFLMTLLFSTQTLAYDVYHSEAKKLIERIAGVKVPIYHPLLKQMAAKIKSGDRLGAAEIATQHPDFLNTTVKQMALKMSTREETRRLELNDFTAMFVGVTRDELDARLLLTGNFYYIVDRYHPYFDQNEHLRAGIGNAQDNTDNLKFSFLRSNHHFGTVDNLYFDFAKTLKRIDGQKVVRGIQDNDNSQDVLPNPEPAGVLTSRTFLEAHLFAGTNRRPIEYTFRQFMCVPMEEMADTSVSDERIGRDIDRFPGGDGLKFQTTCKGCHTQMDSFRGAFANWEWVAEGSQNSILGENRYKQNGAVMDFFDPNGMSHKVVKNGHVFPTGYVQKDNSFFNNSLGKANAELFGWRLKSIHGKGTTDFGRQIADSKRFSQCMVKRVYDSVCRTNINPKTELAFLKQQAEIFENTNYNMKKLYQRLSILDTCGTK